MGSWILREEEGEEPPLEGWITINLSDSNGGRPIRFSSFKIVILANTQGGKDSRIRGIRFL